MNFLKYIEYLFLIYGISFHLVVGQTNNEGKSDCTILYNFLNGDTEDYGNSCCSEDNIFIDCDDEGYITSFINAADEVIDIPSFPRLSRMENLSFVGLSIKEIPDNIFKFTTLKRLNFYINKIEVIPPAIQNLSNLEEIILDENNIKEIPNEIFTLKNLKSLDLGKNNIEVIPPAIQKLSKLEELYFHHNNIKEIPNELFQLKNLRSIYMNDNPISDAKIIKFGDKSLVYCDLSKINISCYEPNTCKTILLANSRKINDEIAQKEFKKCTKEEISSIMELTESKAEAESQTESKNNSSQESKINKINKNIVNRNDKIPNFPSIIKSVIVLGGIIVAFIGKPNQILN